MRFADAAKRAFSFLEQTGFQLTAIEPARLKYESARVLVTVEWDARSGELQAFLGMQAKDGETLDMFSLSDLLGAMNVDLPESKTPFQVSDEGRLGPFLDRLAEDMRDNAQAALAGDRVFYRELQRYRNSQAQAYMRDMNLRRVRARAEEAWRAHDFDKVVNLYSPVEDELTTSERAKLAYARQQRPKT